MFYLENIFTKGTKGIFIEGKHAQIPVNEDYPIVGEILSYNETTGKIAFKKAWDLSTSPKTFFAVAMFKGKSGIPPSTLVNTGQKADFFRVGIGNVDFSGTQPTFQLNDADTTSKASFVAFFFPEE